MKLTAIEINIEKVKDARRSVNSPPLTAFTTTSTLTILCDATLELLAQIEFIREGLRLTREELQELEDVEQE